MSTLPALYLLTTPRRAASVMVEPLVKDVALVVASVFLSHSSRDNEFCERLALDLAEYEIKVWFDEWEIKVGDSLRAKISTGIEEHEHLAVVLSHASVESDWVQVELNAALAKELRERRVVVLPVLIEDCKLPTFLEDKKWADFRSDYDRGLQQLLEALGIKEPRRASKTPASPSGPRHRNDELAFPPERFEDWFVDRLEEGNQIRLRRLFWNWRDAVRGMAPEASPEAIPAKQLGMTTTDQQLLDYIAIAGNVAIRFAQKDQFNLIANLLYDAYSTVNRWGTSDGTTSADWNVRPSEARCCVLDLVFSLGAAAMDAEKYDFLAPLLNRTTPDRYWEHRSWFRYALTMAARGEPQRGSKWYVPTGRARDYIASRDILLKYFVSVDQVLDRACQFDLVQCLYWVFRSGLSDGLNDSYPSCALSAPVHVASLVRMLIAREGPAGIVGEYSDPQLADTIIAFTKIARDTAGLMAYAGWADEGWDDPVIQEFLKRSRAAAQ